MGHQSITVTDTGYAPVMIYFFFILGIAKTVYTSMKPISTSGSFILFLITAISVKAGSLANDALPHREASVTFVDVLRQNEEINLCETFPKMKKDDEFGCYQVESWRRTVSRCWRTCVGEGTCGRLNWCNIDNSKCTLSQYKKAKCVNKKYNDDRRRCPKKYEKLCNTRAGVSYDCDSTAKCRRSCESGESGCRSDGMCYVNEGDDNHKACSSDESCKIATYYPCLG